MFIFTYPWVSVFLFSILTAWGALAVTMLLGNIFFYWQINAVQIHDEQMTENWHATRELHSYETREKKDQKSCIVHPKLHDFKVTFPPNILIEKFCQSAKRIIGVSSAAVVRDVFATTASFKRCTVLHNTFPVCTTVYVFQANSTHTLALPAESSTTNTSTHHAVSSWLLDPGRYAVHTKAYYNG